MASDDILKEIELTESLTKKKKELFEQGQKLLAQNLEIQRATGDEIKQSDILRAASAQKIVNSQKLLEAAEEERASLDKLYIEKTALLDLDIEAQKHKKVNVPLLKKEIEDLALKKDAIIDVVSGLKDENNAVELNEKALQKRMDMADGTASSIAGLMSVSDSWRKGIIGTTASLLKQEDGVERLTIAFSEQFSLQNIGASLIGKVVEASLYLLQQQDEAIASFKAATGAGNAYNDVIVDTQLALRTYGVSAAEAGAATTALFKSMSQFSEMTEQSKKELVGAVALLGKFGVSADEAAKSLNILQKALGMTATQATATARELFAVGKALSIAPEIIMNEFGPAAGQLAAYGDNMISVFKGVAAASKATGIAIGDLLAVTEQFDTFDGAANAVGKLNALLGGPYLNSIEMLNATEEERIRLLIQSMEMSGRHFGDLGKFEQKAIAASVGITDMAKANMLFNTSLSAYDSMQMKASAASISQEEFEEASKDAMSVVAKFTTILENFAVSLAWLLGPLGKVADGILALQKWLGEGFGAVVAITGALFFLVGSFKVLGAAISLVSMSIKMGLAKGMEKLGESLGKAGKKAKTGAKGLLAVGAAVGMIGLGVALASVGVADLVRSFADLEGWQIAGALGAIALGLIALVAVVYILGAAAISGVGAAGAGMLIAIGFAVTLIGAGVYLAATGMAELVKNLPKLVTAFGELPVSHLLIFTAALAALMVGLVAASLIGPIVAFGLFTLSIGIAFLAASMAGLFASLDLEKMSALAEMAMAVNTMLGTSETSDSSQPGGSTQSPFTQMVTAVSNLDGDKIELAKQLSEVAMKYNVKVVEVFGGSSKPAPALAPSSQSNGGIGGANSAPIYLVLDGQIFGRVAAAAIAKEKNLPVTVRSSP